MKQQTLLSLPELHAHALHFFDEKFENDQDCIVDACSGGIYHEEDGDITWVESRLNREELGSLFPSICHALIRGAGHSQDTDGIETILVCYAALASWVREELESADVLIDALAKVRVLVFAGLKENPGAWWFKMVQSMKILETGVLRREGRDPIVEINKEYLAVDCF